MELFSIATFGHFWPLHGYLTATHGNKFSMANNFIKLPHLRKVAVMMAIWQHCSLFRPKSENLGWTKTRVETFFSTRFFF
jgi:hypothetical protein